MKKGAKSGQELFIYYGEIYFEGREDEDEEELGFGE
jgi:hypothetical protein